MQNSSDKTFHWHGHALVCIGSNWYHVHLLTLLELKQPENIRLDKKKIESTNSTSMEDVSTGVLEKIKNT